MKITEAKKEGGGRTLENLKYRSITPGSILPCPDLGEDEAVIDGPPPPTIGVASFQASLLVCISSIKQHAGDGAAHADSGHYLECEVWTG